MNIGCSLGIIGLSVGLLGCPPNVEDRVSDLERKVEVLESKVPEAGAQGERGPQGIQGERGLAGENGTSCYGESNPEGVLITCGEEEFQVRHGERGIQGESGPQGEEGVPGLQGERGPVGPSLAVYDAEGRHVGYAFGWRQGPSFYLQGTKPPSNIVVFDVNINKIYNLHPATAEPLFNPNLTENEEVTDLRWMGLTALGTYFVEPDCQGPPLLGFSNPYDIIALDGDPENLITPRDGQQPAHLLVRSTQATQGNCVNNQDPFFLRNAVQVEPIELPEYVGPLSIVVE